MAHLTIQNAIDFLQSKVDAAPAADRDRILMLLPGNLGMAAMTNAKPDHPDDLLIEIGGRAMPAIQAIIHLKNILGNGEAKDAVSFPGVATYVDEMNPGNGEVRKVVDLTVPISSHAMKGTARVWMRGPGRTEQVEAEVGGVKQMVGRYVPDPIVPVESL